MNKKQREIELFTRLGIPLANEENKLQIDIEADLKAMRDKGILDYLHINSGGKKSTAQAQKAGEPDLIIYCEDKNTFFVELKSKKGKLRAKQIKNMELKRGLGYEWYIVNSYQEWEKIKKEEIK